MSITGSERRNYFHFFYIAFSYIFLYTFHHANSKVKMKNENWKRYQFSSNARNVRKITNINDKKRIFNVKNIKWIGLVPSENRKKIYQIEKKQENYVAWFFLVVVEKTIYTLWIIYIITFCYGNLETLQMVHCFHSANVLVTQKRDCLNECPNTYRHVWWYGSSFFFIYIHCTL